MTQPVFFVGSGRSGTKAIVEILGSHPSVEAHHEYLTTVIQPLSAKFFMGLVDQTFVEKSLSSAHGAAIYWSDKDVWIDSSHKLSWIIGPLMNVFPDAKFVWIRRDGRKVAKSFAEKLGREIYSPTAMSRLTQWLQDRSLPEPPPEKRYWWNVPTGAQAFADEFPSMTQFERCTYHWVSAHTAIRDAFQRVVPQGQQLAVKLEDLVAQPNLQQRLADFLEVPVESLLSQHLSRPRHVIVPTDFEMTQREQESFLRIAGKEMHRSGYKIDASAYSMKYGQPDMLVGEQ